MAILPPKRAMTRLRLKTSWWKVLALCPLAMFSCSKDLPETGNSTEGGQKPFIPVESIIFELNGVRYQSGTNGGRNDTVSLQEEGIRSFRILGYEPADANPVPSVTDINFYQDIYAFNYAKDSIVTLGGEYAKPVNHYLSFIKGDFQLLKDMPLAETDTVKFYNKVNRANDRSVIEIDGVMQEIFWESLGKYRSYRIELDIQQQNDAMYLKQTFSLPFYEMTNKVKIIGFPDESSLCIELSPGDSLQLKFMVAAPEEFTRYEWTKGAANERFDILNRERIWQLYMEDLQNPLLTETGKLYTDSRVTLDSDGMLRVDKNWNAGQATSNGGHIYNEVPVCIVMMPHLNSTDDTTNNTTTPFFCNGTVKILPYR